jgi:NIPSNAP
MQRRRFVKSSLLAASAISASALPVNPFTAPIEKKACYELREYEAHFGTNENDLHGYFEKALIPALNRVGVSHVGVFKELSKSDPAKIYLLIAYASWEELPSINLQLSTDPEFKKSASNYDQLSAEKFPYARYKTKLMIAFDKQPQMIIPAKGSRLFELRTYEGYNEDALRRKLKMFNEEEFAIFDRTGLNRVFFGEVIAGNDMPCLTYMISLAGMDAHDRNWAAFGADPDWQRISKAPEYANTVSRITKIFLEPVAYSQL